MFINNFNTVRCDLYAYICEREYKVQDVIDIQGKSPVARVIRQFEDCKARVEKYHKESDYFRSLCEDFAVCERALEKWQASNAATADQRRQEYTELLAELRNEIQDWLEEQSISDESNKESGPLDPHTS